MFCELNIFILKSFEFAFFTSSINLLNVTTKALVSFSYKEYIKGNKGNIDVPNQ